ncbi:hypothetical protein SO802_019286 [Lithocarpus litseifolius]|uniref:RNase H type-1 domain-containing protein n=1 Tax=Lithocarpus litseifolius TaxID=425828 RepID=A0AAW2CNS2_9ROSI
MDKGCGPKNTISAATKPTLGKRALQCGEAMAILGTESRERKRSSGGGLALLWKTQVQLDVVNYTDHHILAKVVEDDGFEWMLTCFYGWPKSSQKKKSWALLSHLSTFVRGPWFFIGDFNAILHSNEKQSKFPPQFNQMDEFRLALDACNVADLGFVGYPFTWNNKRPGAANTRMRLDQAVANMGWREKFHASTVTHLYSHASNHRPLILQTRVGWRKQHRNSRAFWFEEACLLWEDCEKTVQESWCNVGSALSVLKRTKEKISKCGADLAAWGSLKTQPATEEIKNLQKQVEELSKEKATEENGSALLEARSRAQLAVLTNPGSVQVWSPPTGSVYKLNFDAAVFTSTRSSSVGVIVRNSLGEVMAGLSAHGPAVANSEEAEALACRKAIEFAIDAGFMDLVIEGDNAAVMKATASPRLDRSRLGHIYDDIRMLAAGFRSWSVGCVKRSANSTAHCLARFASQLEEELVWLEESPPPALDSLYVDASLLNDE